MRSHPGRMEDFVSSAATVKWCLIFLQELSEHSVEPAARYILPDAFATVIPLKIATPSAMGLQASFAASILRFVFGNVIGNQGVRLSR